MRAFGWTVRKITEISVFRSTLYFRNSREIKMAMNFFLNRIIHLFIQEKLLLCKWTLHLSKFHSFSGFSVKKKY